MREWVTLWCLSPLFHSVVKKNELKLNEAEYKIIEEIIMARKEKKLTQKDLAGRALLPDTQILLNRH